MQLLNSSSQQLVTAHLRDGWADCQMRPGDCVNLLGEPQEAADGRLHAVCDFKSGGQLPAMCALSAAMICAVNVGLSSRVSIMHLALTREQEAAWPYEEPGRVGVHRFNPPCSALGQPPCWYWFLPRPSACHHLKA